MLSVDSKREFKDVRSSEGKLLVKVGFPTLTGKENKENSKSYRLIKLQFSWKIHNWNEEFLNWDLKSRVEYGIQIFNVKILSCDVEIQN